MEEPLSLLAPLAAELSEQHCRQDESPTGSCAWYHGTVDYLRLLGVISSPADDSGFLIPAFERLARAGARRVLISGAGDCSMLAQVLAGFQAAGATPEVTLFDRCATPVKLNEWFAQRQNLAIETVVCNALNFESEAAFDIICTHCFLGYFTRDERPALFSKWFSLLRPGGHVVTVSPIRKVETHDFVGFAPEQAVAFEARALAAAQERPEAFDGDTSELRRRIRGFTDNFGSFPVRCVDEYTGLFEKAGFVVQVCEDLSGGSGGGGSGGGGPAEKSLVYQSAVARRP